MKNKFVNFSNTLALLVLFTFISDIAFAQRWGRGRGYGERMTHREFNERRNYGYGNNYNYSGVYYRQPTIVVSPPMPYNYGCRPRFHRRWHRRIWGW